MEHGNIILSQKFSAINYLLKLKLNLVFASLTFGFSILPLKESFFPTKDLSLSKIKPEVPKLISLITLPFSSIRFTTLPPNDLYFSSGFKAFLYTTSVGNAKPKP